MHLTKIVIFEINTVVYIYYDLAFIQGRPVCSQVSYSSVYALKTMKSPEAIASPAAR